MKVTVDWTRTVAVSKLTPSLHKDVVPETRPSGTLRDAANRVLRDLAPDYARYRFDFVYPKVTIPESSLEELTERLNVGYHPLRADLNGRV